MKHRFVRGMAVGLCLSLLLSGTALATEMEMPMEGGMPGGEMMGPPPDGGGGPGGGPGGGDAAPTEAAIVIVDGAEDTESEYEPGAYSGLLSQDGDTTVIDGLSLQSGDYTLNGISVSNSQVRLQKATIRLGVDAPASDDDTGGAALNIDNGATVYVSDSDLVVDGAARYVTANYNDGTLIVNNSRVQSTGSNDNTAEVSEPFSNEALLISGTARANFSIGATKTYYFNSTCIAEGWAALSTDSATGDGLDLYAYNTDGIAENGGYSTYADTNCRVWLYGSRLTAAEIGCIISKSGQIHAMPASDADEELLQYNEGDTVEADTSIVGGRNAVMIHAPDMMGQGLMAADCGTFVAKNSELATSQDLVSTKDYNDYGEAVGAYIDYVSGSVFLVRSTSTNIDLEGCTMDSYNGTLIHTVLNADSMGNFLAAGDGDQVNPIAVTMTDMDVSGDIRHEDYQRRMTVTLANTTLTGNIVSGTMDSWNDTWKDYGDVNWVVDDSFDAVYGVELTLESGAKWNVTGESSLTSLTVAEADQIVGTVTLDGEEITPEPGETYTGTITVSGDYTEPVEEEASQVEEAQETTEPAQTETPAQESENAPAQESTQETAPEPQEEASGHTGLVIGLVAIVVVAIIAGAVVVTKKKKK